MVVSWDSPYGTAASRSVDAKPVQQSVQLRREGKDTTKSAIELLAMAKQFKDTLSSKFVGREEEVRVVALAFISGLPAVFIGPPGTAKSEVVREGAKLVSSNDNYFPYQVNKYTDPSELLGPIDIVALKEQGLYRRITKNKLPEAQIAYLDEIFNANSSILNIMLSILQERVFYDGYGGEKKVPLHTLIASTNNTPEEPELAALYDRLVIRHFVKPVTEDMWGDLLDATWKGSKEARKETGPVMSIDDLKQLGAMMEKMDEPVKAEYLKILKILSGKGIQMSDRRKGQAQTVIAANALLHGRTKPQVEDLIVLKYIAPTTSEEYDLVSGMLIKELKLVEKYMQELQAVHQNIKASFEEMRQNGTDMGADYVKDNADKVKANIKGLAEESNSEAVIKYAKQIIAEMDQLLSGDDKEAGSG